MSRFVELGPPSKFVELPREKAPSPAAETFAERAIVDPARRGVATVRMNAAFERLYHAQQPDQRLAAEQFGAQAAGAVPPPRPPDPATIDRARQDYLDAVSELHSMEVNPVVARAMRDPEGGAFWEEFKANPVELTTALFLQSVPQAAPAMASAIVGAAAGGPPGAALGAGLGSFAVEQSAGFVDSFSRQGVDMAQPEAVQAAMADPATVARARAYAATRGVAVATFDALTAGIASKTLAPLGGATRIRRQMQNVPAQMIAQPVGGAAGEAAAQVATTGGIESVPEIAAEALAEIPGAPFELAGIRGAQAAGGRGAPAQLGPMQPAPTGGVFYQGSPREELEGGALADEFIGTGEGAAAYGFGHYLAEEQGVAESYRPQVDTVEGQELFTIDGRDSGSDLPATALSAVARLGQARAEEEYRSDIDQAERDEDLGLAAELRAELPAIESLRGKEVRIVPQGALHTFHVDAAAVKRMLDWDAPLAAQAQEVQEGLAGAGAAPEAVEAWLRGPAASKFGERLLAEGPTGMTAYRFLAEDPATGAQDFPTASQRLQEAGVPGVRYLDQGSRAEGTGTRNLVLFDGSQATLQATNGRPVPQLENAPESVRAQIAVEGAEVGTVPPPAEPPGDGPALPPAILDALPPGDRPAAKRWTSLTKWGWTLLQVFERNMDIPEVAQYVQEMVNAHNVATTWRQRALETYHEWRGLGRARSARLGDFLLELTLLNRRPTPEELDALYARYQMDDDMVVAYDRISKDFDDFITSMRDAAIHNAKVTLTDAGAVAEEVARITREFDKLLDKPYFPLARFGKHAIVVQTQMDRTVDGIERAEGATSHLFLYDTTAERNLALGEKRREFPENRFWTVSTDTITDQALLWQGLPPPVLDTIKNLPGMNEASRAQLEMLSVAWAPSESFRKSMAKRKRVAGFSRDAMRAYAQYFFKGGSHLARVRHMGAAERALTRFEKSVSGYTPRLQPGEETLTGGALERAHQQAALEQSRLRNVQQWLQDHLEYARNPVEEWTGLRNLAFHWYLGFSAASAAVNLTQPFMVTGPFLAARFGDGPAIATFTKAYRDTGKAFWEGAGLRRPDERALVKWAIQTGFVDESQATELGGFSRAGLLARSAGGTWMQQVLVKNGQYSGYMFQTAERVNRRQTMLAAYRLALKFPDNADVKRVADAFAAQTNPSTPGSLTDPQGPFRMNRREARAAIFSRWAVWKTQYEYSRYNRARFMRGALGANVFVFVQYLQNSLWFAKNDPGGWRYLGILFATAGLMGLPGAEDLTEIAKALMRLGGKPEWARDLRGAVGEVAEAISLDPDLFLHGASRYTTGLPAALGWSNWPVPGVDLSGRISTGRVVPGLAEVSQTVGVREDDWDFGSDFMRTTTDVAGAAFAIPVHVMQALLSDNPDMYKRVERALPTVVKNAWQAKQSLAGMPERTRSGKPVVPFDPEDGHHNFEAIMRGMGFRPERSSRLWDLRVAQTHAARYYTGYRAYLLDALDEARVNGDRDAVSDARREIREWNRDIKKVDRGLAIAPKDMRQSRKARAKGRRKSLHGRSPTKQTRRLYRDIARGRRKPPTRPRASRFEELN